MYYREKAVHPECSWSITLNISLTDSQFFSVYPFPTMLNETSTGRPITLYSCDRTSLSLSSPRLTVYLGYAGLLDQPYFLQSPFTLTFSTFLSSDIYIQGYKLSSKHGFSFIPPILMSYVLYHFHFVTVFDPYYSEVHFLIFQMYKTFSGLYVCYWLLDHSLWLKNIFGMISTLPFIEICFMAHSISGQYL